MTAKEFPSITTKVLHIEAEEDHVLLTQRRHPCSSTGLLGAGRTPRRPEVQDDRGSTKFLCRNLSAGSGGREPGSHARRNPSGFQHPQGETGRRRRATVGETLIDRIVGRGRREAGCEQGDQQRRGQYRGEAAEFPRDRRGQGACLLRVMCRTVVAGEGGAIPRAARLGAVFFLFLYIWTDGSRRSSNRGDARLRGVQAAQLPDATRTGATIRTGSRCASSAAGAAAILRTRRRVSAHGWRAPDGNKPSKRKAKRLEQEAQASRRAGERESSSSTERPSRPRSERRGAGGAPASWSASRPSEPRIEAAPAGAEDERVQPLLPKRQPPREVATKERAKACAGPPSPPEKRRESKPARAERKRAAPARPSRQLLRPGLGGAAPRPVAGPQPGHAGDRGRGRVLLHRRRLPRRSGTSSSTSSSRLILCED